MMLNIVKAYYIHIEKYPYETEYNLHSICATKTENDVYKPGKTKVIVEYKYLMIKSQCLIFIKH